MPGTGLEPASPCEHVDLNHACLPVPPPGHSPFLSITKFILSMRTSTVRPYCQGGIAMLVSRADEEFPSRRQLWLLRKAPQKNRQKRSQPSRGPRIQEVQGQSQGDRPARGRRRRTLVQDHVRPPRVPAEDVLFCPICRSRKAGFEGAPKTATEAAPKTATETDPEVATEALGGPGRGQVEAPCRRRSSFARKKRESRSQAQHRCPDITAAFQREGAGARAP